ncbi:sigma-54-dependent Fis family transcriptional regulator [bacterium AH-315-P07]|nr:sigma-54-dependent Fis family transcriptional regulator [bacterium AH-315-P07]
MSRKRILVVDDEQGMRELLEIILGNDGYDVETAHDVESGLACLEKARFDAVVTDLRIGSDKNAGMSLLSWIQENMESTPAIMMTAHGSVEAAIEAMKRGAADFVMKPFKNDEMKFVIQRVIEQGEMQRENRTLKKEQAKLGQVRNMIGTSRAMEQVRDMIRRIALLPSTIAIYGESGTGKELVARSIHQLSDRADKPFVAINCGGIPENLLESELFGHRKGSFTGAYEDKEGLFLAADGGTLFLDEIGEMPMQLQVKLLRVLDNNSITPLGDTRSISVDVRLLSATNRDLEERTKEGAFREDLYYRLNVIPIKLPSLSERKDDIPLLVHHFVAQYAETLGRPPLDVSDEVMSILSAYRWPGNVRELGNIIERAVALSQDATLSENDLPENIRHFMPEPSEQITMLPDEGVVLETLVENLEIGLIQQALTATQNSRKKSAKLLGLTTRSFRYRLQKYGLENNAEEND